jgi:hypothetical protein
VTATCSPRVWHRVIHWVWHHRALGWRDGRHLVPSTRKIGPLNPHFLYIWLVRFPISGRISAIQLFSAWWIIVIQPDMNGTSIAIEP